MFSPTEKNPTTAPTITPTPQPEILPPVPEPATKPSPFTRPDWATPGEEPKPKALVFKE